MLFLRSFVTRRILLTIIHGLRSQRRQLSGKWFRGEEDGQSFYRESCTTLAIETSCDDTSVAVLSVGKEYHDDGPWFRSEIMFHERITANSAQYGGIHPIVALDSHQRNLGALVQRAIKCIPEETSEIEEPRVRVRPRADLIAVTRGPGMRSNLSVGLDLAKGLALAWDVPLIGVHHMQAHTLTPRFCSTSKSSDGSGRVVYQANAPKEPDWVQSWKARDIAPRFPFLTVLASGGHSTLLSSDSLTVHKTLAETADIALGDCLDKAARAIVPADQLKAPYGKTLEEFAFPLVDVSPHIPDEPKYDYIPPRSRQEELERRPTKWGWSIGPPLAESKGGQKSSRRMMYSFAGVLSTVERLMAGPHGSSRSIEERRDLARETMRVVFEHLTSRILLHLHDLTPEQRNEISTIVVSGGVAANKYLRHILRSTLDYRDYQHIKLEFPPVEICTDNALMIAWAGLEMFDAGYESALEIGPIRKWSLDPSSQDGGILGAGGWARIGQDTNYEDEIEKSRSRLRR